jgi:plasmid stabilization system protein ParE
MAYNLQIAERANDQIDKLTGYLINRLHNRDAAIHFLNGLDVVYRRLEENPYQFPASSDVFLQRQGYREAFLTGMRYRIVFRVDGQTVYVVGVFHMLENYIVKVEDFT